MSFNTSFLLSPLVLLSTFVVPSVTLAEQVQVEYQIQPESIAEIEFSSNQLAQVNSVSQLSDVQPNDWAFQALQSLVERYGCIVGYPNGTYRGDRPITRYEFAAGLNACLDRVNELIATSTASLVTKEDLATLQKLQQEFSAELATLRDRVDTLEASTAQLEANQFSTTTKLTGEAIFAVAGVFGDQAADNNNNSDDNPDLEDNIILADRVRLTLDTSFSGRDRLRTRLQARNVTEFQNDVTGTRMTRLGFDGDEDNDVGITELYYKFPVGDQLKVIVAPVKGNLDDIVQTLSPFQSSGSGSISRFGRYNPIYRSIVSGAALGLTYGVSKNTSLTLAYKASDGSDPTNSNGLFDGNYSALAQLIFQPIKSFDLSLTYIRSYYTENGNTGVNVTSSTGSENARRPFGNVATSADTLGLETNWRISPKFIIGGWAGYSLAHSEVSDDDADILNYAVTLAFPDLGGEGNLGGIVFGMPPKVISSSQTEDRDTSLHIEGFYRLQITDNISITPGVFVITNPEHNDNNDSIFVGTIRTTFKF